MPPPSKAMKDNVADWLKEPNRRLLSVWSAGGLGLSLPLLADTLSGHFAIAAYLAGPLPLTKANSLTSFRLLRASEMTLALLCLFWLLCLAIAALRRRGRAAVAGRLNPSQRTLLALPKDPAVSKPVSPPQPVSPPILFSPKNGVLYSPTQSPYSGSARSSTGTSVLTSPASPNNSYTTRFGLSSADDALERLRRAKSASPFQPRTSNLSHRDVRDLLSKSLWEGSDTTKGWQTSLYTPSSNYSRSYECRSYEAEVALASQLESRPVLSPLATGHQSPASRRKRRSSGDRDSLLSPGGRTPGSPHLLDSHAKTSAASRVQASPLAKGSPLVSKTSPSSPVMRHLNAGMLLSYDIDPINLDDVIWRFKSWIHASILRPLVREIEDLNPRLRSHGVEIGAGTLEALETGLARLGVDSAASSLVSYLSISTNQSYIVRRLRSLGRGAGLSGYLWNSGGKLSGSEERAWDGSVPSDASLMLHLLATYFDALLPPYAGGRAFGSRYMKTAAVQSPKSPKGEEVETRGDGVWILSTPPDTHAPHLQLVINGGSEILETGKGADNLFTTFILFFAHLKRECGGRLGSVPLGPSGFNVLKILG